MYAVRYSRECWSLDVRIDREAPDSRRGGRGHGFRSRLCLAELRRDESWRRLGQFPASTRQRSL